MHTTTSPTIIPCFFDLPHPDHNFFNLFLCGLVTLGILYQFPPSLWNSRPGLNLYLLGPWAIALLVGVGTALRARARIQLTSSEFINLNLLTNRKKSVRLDEIQSYSLGRVSNKHNALRLRVTTRQGQSINFTFHEECEDAFIAEMDRRRSSGVYREV